MMAALCLVAWVLIGGAVEPADGVAAPALRAITLRAPFTTIVRAERLQAKPQRLEAILVVPADAPGDLRVSAFVSDAHGLWFRSVQTMILAPGRQHLSFALDEQAQLIGEPHRAAWTPSAHATVTEGFAIQVPVEAWTRAASMRFHGRVPRNMRASAGRPAPPWCRAGCGRPDAGAIARARWTTTALQLRDTCGCDRPSPSDRR